MFIKVFTFSIFGENTYILSDENADCVIIDPGCYTTSERQKIVQYLETNQLTIKAIWLTHGHIDHISGLDFLKKKYNAPIYAHPKVKEEIRYSLQYGAMYGMELTACPEPDFWIEEGDVLHFGTRSFSVLYTPGHSPGSVSLYCKQEKCVIVGDVIFQDSVGRWDLPGGNFDTLMQSIIQKIYPLPDETKIYSGHGISTSVGGEKLTNLYVLEYLNKK